MNTTIVLFLLVGAGFGLLTYAHRHLFSEGRAPGGDAPVGVELGGRIVWMGICAFLWPLLALSGLNSLVLIARRRAQAARVVRASGE